MRDEKREVGILLLFSSWGDPSTRVTHHRLRRFNNVEPGYTLVAQKGETEIHPVCPFKVHLEQVDPVEYIISRDMVNFHWVPSTSDLPCPRSCQCPCPFKEGHDSASIRDAYEPPAIFPPQSAVRSGSQSGRQGFASKRFKGRFDQAL
jgi:hypothetical protein